METIEKLTIVIVADNPLFAEMLRRSMEAGLKEDINVQTFATAESLFKELERDRPRPDVIVLDYNLEKKADKDQVCKATIDRIKSISPEIAVVVISDEEQMPEAAKTLQYGANEYVTKDKFAFSHITSAVRNCLNPSQL